MDLQAALARDHGRDWPGRGLSGHGCIGYLTKYLTKHVADYHHPDTDAQEEHAARLAQALRYEPCSPGCANWLRYGVQPSNARPGLKPGHCRGKAHRRQHLGYGGRRVRLAQVVRQDAR